CRPSLNRRRERVLDRFLGEADVAERAHQDGYGTTVPLAEHPLDLCRRYHRHAFSVSAFIDEGTHLDGQRGCGCQLSSPCKSRIESGRFADQKPADVFLALSIGPINRQDLALARSEHRRRPWSVEAPGKDPCSS